MPARLTAAGRRILWERLREYVADARDLIADVLHDYAVNVDVHGDLSVEHRRCGAVLDIDLDQSQPAPMPRLVKACVDHALSCPRQD